MDDLQQIIDSLDANERRSFRVFIRRRRQRSNRKDLVLFNILCSDQVMPRHVIMDRIFGSINDNAYHALRKRLLEHLLSFIVIIGTESDADTTAPVRRYLAMASFLFEREKDRIAWKYIGKARLLAQNAGLYREWNEILLTAIAHAPGAHAIPVNQLVREWQDIRHYVAQEEQSAMALALVRDQLEYHRLEGSIVHFEAIVQGVMKTVGIGSTNELHPPVVCRLAGMARAEAIASKRFDSFAPYVCQIYNQLEAEDAFISSLHQHKLLLLYYAAHAQYRIRHFDESRRWLEQLKEAMDEHNRVNYYRFYARYLLLSSALLSFTGNNQDAINILENIPPGDLKRLSRSDRLNLIINRCVYYFQQDDFEQAQKILEGLKHSDRWYVARMGREWVLKKNLIRLIIAYECGDIDLMSRLLRQVERTYKYLFILPLYARVRDFLKLIRRFVDQPVSERKLMEEEMRQMLVNIPREHEDIQAMAFYSWLKSRISGRSYYQVLLEVVSG